MNKQAGQFIPLAERMRPRTLDEFVGQQKILGADKPLRRLIEQKEPISAIFWGPPGVGKTTLAHIIAEESGSFLISLSGVSSGKADLTEAIKIADHKQKEHIRTILFVDEIHRWNKAQQDALLPFVEKGTITLMGATTENPSFSVIRALLSRSHVYILAYLSEVEIGELIQRAATDSERGLGTIALSMSDDAVSTLSGLSGGDARRALNGLELAVKAAQKKNGTIELTPEIVTLAMEKTSLIFDKQGEEFYNTISALHKSMRGSDANAALYWLARMLEGGADPVYLARRIVRFASEDIGMANSEALIQATAAMYAAQNIGMPECSVHLAQAVVYCAKSKKSNKLYVAYNQAAADARDTSHLGVPLHLRNAPTAFMKDIGYGNGYLYNPDYQDEVKQDYFPDELRGREYV